MFLLFVSQWGSLNVAAAQWAQIIKKHLDMKQCFQKCTITTNSEHVQSFAKLVSSALKTQLNIRMYLSISEY